MSLDEPATPEQLDRVEALIDAWLGEASASNPVVGAVERGEPGERRWYVRVHGEEKDVYSIWFTLGQRTLAYETFLMPAPEEHHAVLYEHLLRRNLKLYGVQLAIGAEDAIFLVGHLAVDHVDEDALDWVLGTVYAAVELCFRPAIRIGFASKFGDR